MFCHVDPIVAAGVEVKLVGNVPRVKRFVQSYGTGVETKIVFRAAIEVDLQSVAEQGERNEADEGEGRQQTRPSKAAGKGRSEPHARR